MSNTADKRLPVYIRQIKGGWQIKQPWAKRPELRVWREFPDFPGIAIAREKIENLGYRVEVVK